MVRPVIFVPYFLHVHCAIGQSLTSTINLDTNQFHLHISLHHQACIHNPIFTNNFPIIYFFSLCLLQKFLAASLLPNPHFFNAIFNLVGSPLEFFKEPAMLPNLQANDTLRLPVPLVCLAPRVLPVSDLCFDRIFLFCFSYDDSVILKGELCC